jgi:hypothetical protein
MKKLLLLAVLALTGISEAKVDVYVRGYTRRDGTQVQGHYRSDPDGIKSNNYSYPGNTNPYHSGSGSNGSGTQGGSYDRYND